MISHVLNDSFVRVAGPVGADERRRTHVALRPVAGGTHLLLYQAAVPKPDRRQVLRWDGQALHQIAESASDTALLNTMAESAAVLSSAEWVLYWEFGRIFVSILTTSLLLIGIGTAQIARARKQAG